MPPAKQPYRGGKACAECRQQKVRCDAHQDYSQPCSRCRKSNIECVIPNSFKWKKRQSKAAMQREIDVLKAQTIQTEWLPTGPAPQGPSPMEPSATVSLLSPPAFASPQEFTTEDMRNSTLPPTFVSPRGSELDSMTNSQLDPTGSMAAHQPLTATIARTLDGFELEGRKVDDCFGLFFEHYDPYVPFLEHGYSPNQYFVYSPLLFWTMIATGSRKYTDDPTIIQYLAPRSLLLLCAWPFPTETMFSDPSLVYAAAAMQLAVQNGLHMLRKRQDFTRTKLADDEIQEVSRAKLWAWCKIVCQTTTLCRGLQPYIVEDALDSERQRKDLIALLPPDVYWGQKLQSVLNNAITTLMHNNFIIEEDEPNGTLGALIDVLDNQVQEVSRQSEDKIGTLKIILSRLCIRVFHFYEKRETLQDTKLIELHHLACSFIETVSTADLADDYGLYFSEMVYWALMLAACTILRIHRSKLRHQTDLSIGERCFFAVVRLNRKRSIQNNDLSARASHLLTQMWQSKTIFHQQDGTFNSLRVRIRSRGAMGIVYDSYWYWRQEFNGQTDPYAEPGDKAAEVYNPMLPWPLGNLGNDGHDVALPNMEQAGFPDDENFFPSWTLPTV